MRYLPSAPSEDQALLGAIGVARPVSLFVDCHGTEHVAADHATGHGARGLALRQRKGQHGQCGS